MTTLLALLPLLLVLGLLASGRASALAAGSIGLLATLGATVVLVGQRSGSDVLLPLFLRETAAGSGSPGTSSPSSPPACSSIAACRPAAARPRARHWPSIRGACGRCASCWRRSRKR